MILAEQERMARAVGDVAEIDLGAVEKDALVVVPGGNPDVAGQAAHAQIVGPPLDGLPDPSEYPLPPVFSCRKLPFTTKQVYATT